MSQNNPVNNSASRSTTGSVNGPLNTDSTYNSSNTTSSTGHNNSSTGQNNTNNSSIKEAGSGLKNIFAAAHGAGEKLRGEFNTGVDRAFNENEGVEKNSRIANAGDNEMNTGEFTTSTKNREGAVPGDNERRF